MKGESQKIRHASRATWIIAIIIVSTMVGVVVSWRAPGLNLYAGDRLMQARGPISPPDDIVIVAIDEASIARYGRFPWQRGLTARALDTISSAQPRAVALDILYSEPTDSAEDTALADSIKRSGNTIAAAQFIETTDERGAPVASWLHPLPLIESSAAGVGHVNVSTEADGAAREVSLRKADDQGRALWSIAVETIRVGEGIRAASVRDVHGGIQLGTRVIPISRDAPTISLAIQHSYGGFDTSRAADMTIDYIGPPGSFSHQTHSFADVLDGSVPPQSFRGKYVLIGATAATLGDNVASPFVHGEGASGEQHGALMPGVEVLANTMNTILRSRFYHLVPDWLAALLAALVAAAVVGLLAIGQGRFGSAKQIGALFGLLAIILAASYLAFVHWLIVAPVVPALVSFAVAAPLALLRRSIRTSSDLDTRISELTSANELLLFSAPESGFSNNLSPNPATLIAHLAGAKMAAIYLHSNKRGGRFQVVAAHGITTLSFLSKADLLKAIAPIQVIDDSPAGKHESSVSEGYVLHQQEGQLTLRLGDAENPQGALVIGPGAQELRSETLRLCTEIATNYIASMEDDAGMEPQALPAYSRWRFPQGIEWKARALGVLNQRMLARARFVDRALHAVEDGLIVADIGGSIAFANPRASEILGIPGRMLVGSDLFQQLRESENQAPRDEGTGDRSAREMLMRIIVGRTSVEREITIGDSPRRHYMLRLSAVTSGDEGTGQILGLVAALSDVTQQHELEEMKTDVMTLVTHELLTPLTAIQGMSEVLAEFEVAEVRRREMHLAINEESKRLSHMIREYLDITRLESGAHALRVAPVRIAPLIERVLLLLDPLATQRQIRIERHLAPDLPALMVDADLISHALTNLVANAIKYSPSHTEIVLEARNDGDSLLIDITDKGYGIPADALPKIFEKFYRVPRVEDADAKGTGLGLALVREIVELHGGRISVASEAGLGSTFSVRLPLPSRETSAGN